MRKGFSAAAMLLAFGLSSAVALAQVPNADFAIVSNTANTAHARVGQPVTFTVVATNNGPEATTFYVVTAPAQATGARLDSLAIVSQTCFFAHPIPGGNPDGSFSSDGQFCEYGVTQPGDLVRAVFVAEVQAGSKYASDTSCTTSGELELYTDLTDPNPANDCATSTVKIVGKRR